jgi:ABC-2 type transport system ATP-binding protein
MLEARNLTKRYHSVLAVQDVSFRIQPGEILGYLGPNGSGKSTTINMVVGLLEPSSGTLSLFGESLYEKPTAYKRRIGYVPEEPYLYTHLTALEYLSLVGGLRGMPPRAMETAASELLRLFDLWDSRYSVMSAYSKGMRQRVLLAAALLHDPDFLVLDEPFSGLDVNAGLLFRTLLRLFVQSGRMILFSSHRFDIVERVCSRAIILHDGRIVAERDLQAQQRSDSLEEVFANVTQQPDYTEVADRILTVVRAEARGMRAEGG